MDLRKEFEKLYQEYAKLREGLESGEILPGHFNTKQKNLDFALKILKSIPKTKSKTDDAIDVTEASKSEKLTERG